MRNEHWKQQLNFRLYGKDPGNGYQPFLDVLRVLATVFVIAIHTVSYAASLVPAETISYKVLTLLVFTFVSCNLLFIMISGALLLPIEDERAGVFYRKRLRKVVIPLIVYYILYVCAKEGLAASLAPQRLPRLLGRILSGAPEEAPHFWLIYVLIFLYLLTPILRWFLRNIPDYACDGLIAAVFITNTISCYAPLFDVELPVVHSIAGTYAGVFFLGYYLVKRNRRPHNIFFITAGIISYLVTAYLIFCTAGYDNYIYGNAPTMMFYAAGLFVLIRLVTDKKAAASRGYRTPCWLLIRLISRYSYSILLIHWGVLHFLVKQVFRIDVLSGGIWGGCVTMFLLTLMFSLLGAFLLDNTLFLVIDRICRKPYS